MQELDDQIQTNFEDYLNGITSEVQLIQNHVTDRKNIFKKCLKQYKDHLSQEANKLMDSQLNADVKSSMIQSTYEQIYNNISWSTDILLRLLRKTSQVKKMFWKEKMDQFSSSPDLQLKKQLHFLKRDAQQRYLDAIDQRKSLKHPQYKYIAALTQKDRTLTNYQNSNRQFQNNVNIGTFFKLSHLSKDDRKTWFDDKENGTYTNTGAGIVSHKIDPEQEKAELLKQFMRH